jgi:signal transduction histidine kinase
MTGNADLEEFAYIASHDLKAPLRAIAHLAQWIGEDIEPTASPETLGNLTLLRARVIRLQQLLDGLLAYSRAGRMHAEVEAVDVAGLVDDIAAVLAPPPGFVPPGFVIACAGAMPALRTHRPPLRVVLENLIGNALKHHDRSEGRVTVAMRLADGVAEFRVSDDGPGIPERFHDRIFQIFQTLVSRDEVETSGIGLAIVKKTVQGHGGRIHVESAPPARGASFVFTWCEAGGCEAAA